MSLRIIEISAPQESGDKIKELAERYNAIDCWQSNRKSWLYKKEDDRITSRILVDVKNQQDMLDALQRTVRNNDGWRIILIPVEATLPRIEQIEEKPKETDGVTTENDTTVPKLKNKLKIKDILRGSVTREELHDDMDKGGTTTIDFLLLVVLSSLVAGIGLIFSDVAVIIGAMVIAPLLGPNLALAFGAALGDKALIIKAIKTNITGIGLTLVMAVIAGLFISHDTVLQSSEMMNRTNVGFASIALALASGAAAVLSLTMGASSALVGVMVAVALMPPAVTLGVTLGNGQFSLAYGTFLLLATNIVCVNLSAQAIFRLKGIKPRTWYEEKKAQKASKINGLIWLLMLSVLAVLIWLKKQHLGD
jgi:uncharacterized hydrophobic protein (TIGR00341 family)